MANLYVGGQVGDISPVPFFCNPQQETYTMKLNIPLAALLIVAMPHAADATPDANCKSIDAAISANEDFVEVALGIDAMSPDAALKTIHDTAKAVEPSLEKDEAKHLQTTLSAIDAAFKAGHMPEAAVAAMENYAVLVKAFEKRLPTTQDVAMLDYAGFRLLGLVATSPPDWEAMTTTVVLAQTRLKATSVRMKDQGLTDLSVTIATGLQDAAKAKDGPWLAHAAQVLLDSVDLMEPKARSTASQACH
jgi:hypothetical protein